MGSNCAAKVYVFYGLYKHFKDYFSGNLILKAFLAAENYKLSLKFVKNLKKVAKIHNLLTTHNFLVYLQPV